MRAITLEPVGSVVDGTPIIDIRPYMTEYGPQGHASKPALATGLMSAYY